MNCPQCNVPLQMTERQSVEIDYCPECRGVWLDRGELDKLIERSAAWQTRTQPAPAATIKATGGGVPASAPIPGHARPERHDDDDDYPSHGRRKRRGSFLGDLFDFD
jgi:Zn-finger nucleic acid-binding protein